jgi:hypothetical protein
MGEGGEDEEESTEGQSELFED